MKLTRLLCLAAMTLSSLFAAEKPFLKEQAKQAAAALPRGCIVTAEQTGDGPPVFALAGKDQPAGVAPEKVIFEIGSISKVFTGMLLAKAVLDKKVRLDSSLREVMGKGLVFSDANVAAITLEQLATHTSGLPRLPDNGMDNLDMADPYARYDRALLDAYLTKATLAHAPPFASEYSNLGAGLLGDLLARVYGRPWDELVVEFLSRPLGMKDTCVKLNDEQKRRFAPGFAGKEEAGPWSFQSMAGAGALRSTAADMLVLARAVAHPERTPLKEVIEVSLRARAGGKAGLGWQILPGKNKVIWHNGGTGGYSAWVSAKPVGSAKLGVILISNSEMMPEAVMLGSAEVKTPEPGAGPADPALAEFAGKYDTGVKAGVTSIFYTFEARGPALWMQITGQPAIPLERHAGTSDRFVFKPVRAEIQFNRRDGKIVSTTLFQAGLEIHAQKMDAGGSSKAE